MSERLERVVEIVPEAGLHARPASKFVATANEYDAEVQLAREDSDDFVPAGSMIGVTSIGARCGEKVRLVAEGSDAEAALDALETVLTTPEGELDEA